MDGFMIFFFLTWPVTCQSASLRCVSLPPAVTPWISTGAASLSGDNNPEYLPCTGQKSSWDYHLIQGDNPVYSVVKKWAEVSSRNLVQGQDRVGGSCEGWKCRVSLLLLFFTGSCKHIKRGWEAQPIIDATFWIFLSFIFSPLWLRPSEVKKKKKAQLLLQLFGLCHCDSHSGAALGLVVEVVVVVGRARVGFKQPHTYGAGLYLKLGNWLQNTGACSSVLNVCPRTELQWSSVISITHVVMFWQVYNHVTPHFFLFFIVNIYYFNLFLYLAQ